MSRLRIIDARKMEKLLFKLGFERVRQKGSHVFYRHPDGRTTSVPHHQEEIIITLLHLVLFTYGYIPITSYLIYMLH